jgi:protocatechuate 3,4-dioxygenase beta subunit
MRPLHAISLGLALVVLLVAAWLFVGDRSGTASSASSASPESAPKSAAVPHETALEAPPTEQSERNASPGTPAIAPAANVADASPTAADASAFALTGRVVDGAGHPVANALVLADGAAGNVGQALDLSDPELAPWSRRVEAKTGTDGRFDIHPRAQSAVRFAVRAGGFAPYDAERPIAGARHDVGDLVLETSVILKGRVLDSAGRPVVGATLQRLSTSTAGFAFFGGPRGVPVATTDDRGAFVVDQLASGPWKLLITSEDHPDKLEEGDVDRAGATVANLEFVVADGTEISGRVVRAPADAMKNLWVRALPRPPNAERGLLEPADAEIDIAGDPRKARVAPDGTFTLRGLVPGGNYGVSARDSERAWTGRRRTQVVQARAGDRGVELPYQQETAIVFQAVDSISGEPVVELDVQAGYQWRMPMLDEGGRRVRQFPEGRVRYSNLPPPPAAGERAQLRVEAVGYTPFERTDLLVSDGQDYDLGVIRLVRAPVVKVRVTDDKAAPVVGAQVSLAPESSELADGHSMSIRIGEGGEDEALVGGGASLRSRTDKDGVARVTSLPGARARVLVSAPGFAPHASEVIELPVATDAERDVHLTPGGSVVVEVVDSKDQPVAGVGIDHESPSSAFEPMLLDRDGADITDAEGRVRFEHLTPGSHRFKLRDGLGNTFAFGDRGAVVMRRPGMPGAPEPGWSDVLVVDLGVETLRLVAPTRSELSGRITESGKPLASATIRLTDAGAGGPSIAHLMGQGDQARTDGKGEYTLSNVKVGDYRLSVTHASRSMPFEVDVKVREGDNELDLDLSVAIVEGRLEDAGKRPLAGVRVRAERARAQGEPRRMVFTAMMVNDGGDDDSTVTLSSGEEGAEAFSDADGRYRLRGVASDVDIVVKATGKGIQPTESKSFQVAPDQVKSGVDLVLEQGGTVEVTIVHADGRPGASCLVRGSLDAAQPGTADPKLELSNSKGIAKLSGLKPGKWKLNVQRMGLGPENGGDVPPDQIVEVTAGQTASARFEMP